MKKNKVTTYLLYAIGEITLVVLGILIAIQIDDWNQQRIDSTTAKNLLINLKAEQEFNIKYLQAQRAEWSIATSSGLALLRAIETHKILDGRTTDSLIFNLLATNSSNLSNGAVLDIISTNKIDLIRNDTLRSVLLSFGSKLEDLKELQRLNNELLNMGAVPYLYDHLAFAKMDYGFQNFDIDWPKGRFDSDLEHIFNDRKFETIVDDLIFRSLTITRQTDQLLTEIQLSLDLINHELKN